MSPHLGGAAPPPKAVWTPSRPPAALLPKIKLPLVTGIVFSVFMGFFGGLLPAGRAAFTKITDALRQVG